MLLGIATLIVVADRVTKTIVAHNLMLNASWHPSTPLLQRIFSLTHITNTGAAFGLFRNMGWLFIVIHVVVIVAIVVYHRQLPAGFGWTRLALGLQMGGALGNLIDRVRQGYVVDFVDLNFWPVHNWPIFNVADSSIVVGVVFLAISMLREDAMAADGKVDSSEGEAVGETGTSS